MVNTQDPRVNVGASKCQILMRSHPGEASLTLASFIHNSSHNFRASGIIQQTTCQSERNICNMLVMNQMKYSNINQTITPGSGRLGTHHTVTASSLRAKCCLHLQSVSHTGPVFIKHLKSNVYVTLNAIGSFRCYLCSHWLIQFLLLKFLYEYGPWAIFIKHQ